MIVRAVAAFILCLAVVISCGLSPADGAGFAIYAQGGTTLGEATANVAHATDPSAIFFNPALISLLPGTRLQTGTTLIIPDREFESARTGRKTETESEVFFPSTFYATHQVNDRFSLGFGVFNPFGLGTTWPENWEGRYIATKSEMTTFAFNPVAALKPVPWLTVSVGGVYLTLDASFERHLNLGALAAGTPDGIQKLHGTGQGFGFNAGILVEPSEDLAIGVSYRSGIHVPITGDVDFKLPNPAFRAVFPDVGARTSLDLPAQAYAGIYFKHFRPFTFEIAGRWENWSKFKELRVELDQAVAGSATSVTPRDWSDSWAGILSLRYQVSETAAVTGGYQYSGNAVPDNTFEPAIPDADSHYFSVGADLQFKKLQVALGAGYQVFEKRTKRNTVTDPISGDPAFSANGDYQSRLYMVNVSLTYRF